MFKHYLLLNKRRKEIHVFLVQRKKYTRCIRMLINEKDPKQKKKSKLEKDKFRWCNFHYNYGYAITKCKDLKDNLENFMKIIVVNSK